MRVKRCGGVEYCCAVMRYGGMQADLDLPLKNGCCTAEFVWEVLVRSAGQASRGRQFIGRR
jgi:hypothetical protein